MILSLLELTPIPGKREEVLGLLRFCADGLGTKPGCLGCGVYKADGESGSIVYLEYWISVDDLHRHIQSNLYRSVLTAMDLASAPPDIRFCEVSNAKPMELIAALRSPGNLTSGPWG